LTSCKPVSFSRRTLHHGVNIYKLIQLGRARCGLVGWVADGVIVSEEGIYFRALELVD